MGRGGLGLREVFLELGCGHISVGIDSLQPSCQGLEFCPYKEMGVAGGSPHGFWRVTFFGDFFLVNVWSLCGTLVGGSFGVSGVLRPGKNALVYSVRQFI